MPQRTWFINGINSGLGRIAPEVQPYPLDSGLHSRVYPGSLASIQNGVQATFQIGELARRTALSFDAIRFCERRKLLPPASRSAGRFRLYTPDAIERLRFVRRMQGLGFSLQEIKELMGVRAGRTHACSAVRQFLKTKLADVTVRIRDTSNSSENFWRYSPLFHHSIIEAALGNNSRTKRSIKGGLALRLPVALLF